MVYDSFEVGLALREQRIKQGLTIEELAFEVNRSKYHMNLIELGTRKMGMDLLFELVTVLHTDANSILGISSLKSNNNDISIDERLRKLDKNKCQYFTRVFMHMLDNIPA
ncbi:MAG: helix-turn-helix domain-containing protein [Lachnospira sp.]|nr:helix-turn-helix domain-containing protein [Lachnospira sp.]MDD5831498.1 helix-turn-helix transcriptional regulator [Lachnospira sp.]